MTEKPKYFDSMRDGTVVVKMWCQMKVMYPKNIKNKN